MKKKQVRKKAAAKTAHKKMGLEREWKEQGWTLVDVRKGWMHGTKAKFFLFVSSEGSFLPRTPPIGIEPESVVLITPFLCCTGLVWNWKVNTFSSKPLQDPIKVYELLCAPIRESIAGQIRRLAAEAKVSTSKPKPPPHTSQEDLKQKLFRQNLDNQIKTQTMQMAISLGLIRR